MNTKGQTLLEVTLASILAMFLMAGSVGVIENMQRETSRFKTQVDNDTTWMTANIHLARIVRSSSYLEIPRGSNSTLILHNYDTTEKGRYVYNANSRRLEYRVNNGATIQATFNNVEATFTLKPGALRNNQPIEVIINYTGPFANMLCLRCAVGVALPLAGNTWAAYYGIQDMWNNNIGGVIRQTSDGGYIFAGNSDYKLHIVKMRKDGSPEWSKLCTADAGKHLRPNGLDIQETSDKGYIIACSGPALLKLRNDGSVEWFRYLTNISSNLYGAAHSVISTEQGYVAIGHTIDMGGSNKMSAVIWRVDNSGDIIWSKVINSLTNYNSNPLLYHTGNITAYGITESRATKISSVSGYIIVGTIDIGGGGLLNSFIMMLDKAGNIVWQRLVTPQYGSTATGIEQIFDSDGNNDGYVVCGSMGDVKGMHHPYLYRLDLSGAPIASMSKVYQLDAYQWAGWIWSVRKAPNGFIISGSMGPNNTCGTILYIIKTDYSCNEVWRKVYSSTASHNAHPYGWYPGEFNWGPTKLLNTFAEPAEDGGYILYGDLQVYEAGGWGHKAFFIKTDANGDCLEASKPNSYSKALSPEKLVDKRSP